MRERRAAQRRRQGDAHQRQEGLIPFHSCSAPTRPNPDGLPVVLAGDAGGRLATGRHLRLPGERPMSDLFLTMLDLLGAPQERFGDSSGPLAEVLVSGA